MALLLKFFLYVTFNCNTYVLWLVFYYLSENENLRRFNCNNHRNFGNCYTNNNYSCNNICRKLNKWSLKESTEIVAHDLLSTRIEAIKLWLKLNQRKFNGILFTKQTKMESTSDFNDFHGSRLVDCMIFDLTIRC